MWEMLVLRNGIQILLFFRSATQSIDNLRVTSVGATSTSRKQLGEKVPKTNMPQYFCIAISNYAQVKK